MHLLYFLCFFACCSTGLFQEDCSGVTCPVYDACPEGTEAVLLNQTNNGDIYDECCEAFECRPIGCNLGLLQLEHGESFNADACTKCECNKGTLNCTTKPCPKLQCRFREYEGYVNGACCKSCIPIANPDPVPNLCPLGRHFINPSNPCLSCVCMRGRVSCIDKSLACQDLSNCSNAVKLDGQCCSICNDTKEEDNQAAGVPPAECTTSTGQTHKSSTTWSESSCRNCTCSSGDITCTEEICPQITCKIDEVKKIPLGKCCPRCASRLVIDPPRRCLEGSILDSRDPCTKCHCRNGMSSCITQVCLSIPAGCNKVVRVKGQCCPICQSEDSSSSNGTESSAADQSAPVTTDDANHSATTYAPSTAIKTDHTEPTEPTTCDYRGRTLQHRERYSAGPCSFCICLHGFMACTQHQCPPLECSPLQKLEYFPDQCCPRCVGPESGKWDFLTGSVPPLVDLSSTPHEIEEDKEDTTQKTDIVDNGRISTKTQPKDEESLGNVVDEEVQKVVDKLLNNGEIQNAISNAGRLQLKPAQPQKVTGSKSYWIVGAGLGVAALVVIMAVSLIVIYHYRRKATKKLPTVSETI